MKIMFKVFALAMLSAASLTTINALTREISGFGDFNTPAVVVKIDGLSPHELKEFETLASRFESDVETIQRYVTNPPDDYTLFLTFSNYYDHKAKLSNLLMKAMMNMARMSFKHKN